MHRAEIAPCARRHVAKTTAASGWSDGSEGLLVGVFFGVSDLMGEDAVGAVVAVFSPGSSTPVFGTETSIAVGVPVDDVCGAAADVVCGRAGAAVVRDAVNDWANSVRTAVRSPGSGAVTLGTATTLTGTSSA